VHWTGGDGTTFFGSKGWVGLSRGGGDASNPDWFRLKVCEGTKRVLYRNNYYKSFVDSVRERSKSIAPIEDAVRSDALSHLSLLAIMPGAAKSLIGGCHHFLTNKLVPVIACGCGTPSISSRVGATSARMPSFT
jgi:hypothetical protein